MSASEDPVDDELVLTEAELTDDDELREASQARVVVPKKGRVFDADGACRVAIIRPCVSRGKRLRGLPPIYTGQMLEANSGIWANWLMYMDHLTEAMTEAVRRRGRSIHDLGGRILESSWNPTFRGADDDDFGYQPGATIGRVRPRKAIREMIEDDPELLHVSINAFPTDHPSEHAAIQEIAESAGARVAVSTHVADGGEGARELAQVVVDACGQDTNFRYTYELVDPVETKFEKVARGIYGADGIELSATARKQLKLFEKLGYGHLPVVIAKTHLSISSDPKRRGAPRDWTLPIRELRLAAGAGYIYAISGDMRTMPGLGEHPSAEKIDINEQGEIVGLF